MNIVEFAMRLNLNSARIEGILNAIIYNNECSE